MTRHAYGTAMALLFLSLVPPAWGQQYFLYSPKPVTPEEARQGNDGILVREVAIQKGDTLYGISRRISGRGMYYPQILLFNDIRNPNLIHAGDTLKVPVAKDRPVADGAAAPEKKHKAASRKLRKVRKHQAVSAAPARREPVEAKQPSSQLTELSLGELKPAARDKKKRSAAQPGSAARKPVAASEARPVSAARQQEQRSAAADPAAGQRLFERAIKAYRQDDCRTALDLFDRFLTTYPTLPQAADASLYKAECYLKLSRQ